MQKRKLSDTDSDEETDPNDPEYDPRKDEEENSDQEIPLQMYQGPNHAKCSHESGVDTNSHDSTCNSSQKEPEISKSQYSQQEKLDVTQQGETNVTDSTYSNGENLDKKDQSQSQIVSDSSIEKVEEYRDVPDNEKNCDPNYPKVFVRKVLKSHKRKNGLNKKGRVYNSYQACLFCKKLVQHIPTHLKLHKEEPEVIKLLKLVPTSDPNNKQNNSNDYQNQLKMLRAKGNHEHNQRVIASKQGEIFMNRRPKETFDHSLYGPCPKCLEWLRLSSLAKHGKTCVGYKTQSALSSEQARPNLRTLCTQSDILKGVVQPNASKLLVEEVFTIMTCDKISSVAKTDSLITSLGESWLRRSIDNKTKRKYYSSQHMRQAARFLMEIRTLANDETVSMWDTIKPEMFDFGIKSALAIAKPSMDDEMELESPSNAIKFKYDLLRLTFSKIAYAIKSRSETCQRDAESFKTLISISWSEQVTRLARSVLDTRRLNKAVVLPDPEDIRKLGEYLVKSLERLDLDCADWDTFKKTMRLVQTRLLCYNKRRSGELEATL